MKKSLRLTESAIMLALAFVLSMVKVVDMPFGGSVTAFSMLPIIVIAYRYRTAWGLLTGTTYALLQMLMGLKNLTYATSAAACVAIIMLDYIVAFAVLGLGGIFRGKIKNQSSAITAGALTVCILRYICHVISGCTVWAGVSIPTSDGLIYSLAYNAAYMVPETLITVVGAYFAGKAFNLTDEKLKRIPMEKKAATNLLSSLPVAIAVVVCFVMLFGMMQSEDGFDITLIASVDMFKWISLAVILAVGVIASVVIRVAGNKKQA